MKAGYIEWRRLQKRRTLLSIRLPAPLLVMGTAESGVDELVSWLSAAPRTAVMSADSVADLHEWYPSMRFQVGRVLDRARVAGVEPHVRTLLQRLYDPNRHDRLVMVVPTPLAEPTPALEWLGELLPEAIVLHVVRNPWSELEVSDYRDARTFAAEWRYNVRTGARWSVSYPDRYFALVREPLIRYSEGAEAAPGDPLILQRRPGPHDTILRWQSFVELGASVRSLLEHEQGVAIAGMHEFSWDQSKAPPPISMLLAGDRTLYDECWRDAHVYRVLTSGLIPFASRVPADFVDTLV